MKLTQEQQSDKDKKEFQNTVRIQKAGNGFIVKPFGPPMIFLGWEETADYLKKYFKGIK